MTALVPDDLSKRSVLGRVFDILECFTDEAPEQTISSLCGRTGLPPATVHRILASLTEWGAVERASRGRYRLGMRLWRLGWGVPEARVLKDVARPHLVDLHALTGEVVTLCSRDRSDVIIADVIAGRSASRQRHLPRRMPLTSTAAGLVFLAHLSDPEIEELPAGRPGDPFPTNAFTRRQVLDDVRRNGYSVTHATVPGGTAWVAAPILDELRSVRSTIALPVAEERLNVFGMGRVVSAAARAVTQELARAAASAS
jgi:DNA-binding IclR family transcriptional regulator